MIQGRFLTKALSQLILLLACSITVSDSFGQAATPVEVMPLSEVLINLEYKAPAEVQSLNASTLAAEVAATIKSVHADIGQVVQRGDLVLELNATDYRLSLQQAEANLASSTAQKAQADARLQRARELGVQQYISADELLARETDAAVLAAQILVQQAHVDIARNNLQKTRITAPFTGVINARFAQLGAFVTPGSPLLALTETERFELDALVPEESAGTLEHAPTVWFVSRNESWPVHLLRLSPEVEMHSRSRRARFGFGDTAPPIGRSGELFWQVEKGLLPVNLVVRRDGQLGVFLHRSGAAAFVPLPQAQEGRPVVVDLPPDSEIVVQGRERLQDGDTITITRQ